MYSIYLPIGFLITGQQGHLSRNIQETLERPAEHMTVYRNDGSSVTLTAENGRVSIVDSREKNVRHIIEADHFISKIL